MQPKSRAKVIQALHRSRMQPYLDASGGNEKKALTLYSWHTKLTATTQQLLGLTEVVLRNAMDAQLQVWNVANGGGPSWLLQDPVAPLRSLSSGKRGTAFSQAQKEADGRAVGHKRHGHSLSHDDVLAQVMFGMWKDLLPNHSPNASPVDGANLNRIRLWDEALRCAFPYENDLDGHITYWRVAHMHRLRNRVSHMEPLLSIDVEDLMNEAFDLVRSIDPAVANWVTGVSRVSEVLKERPH